TGEFEAVELRDGDDRFGGKGVLDAVSHVDDEIHDALVGFDALDQRDVDRVLIDCSELRHVDFHELPSLLAALDRFEAHSGMIALCGLSRYLRDLFRLVGGRARVEFPASASDPRGTASPAPEPGCECAS
ncbi:MAG TPA: STAS domain-containing protein, partial [Candidatus Eisenbacteria bacterium]|nr:STAS domain-containing protein [Candidatus Eisenbacteria bacterium]